MAKRLGIMITRYENVEHIAGVTKAARTAGHPVQMFLTDEAVKFTRDPRFLELLDLDGVDVAVCEYSCERIGLHDRTDGITYGSQNHNAGMLHDSDRLVVF